MIQVKKGSSVDMDSFMFGNTSLLRLVIFFYYSRVNRSAHSVKLIYISRRAFQASMLYVPNLAMFVTCVNFYL